MKLALTFKKQRSHSIKKKEQFNPHHYWRYLLAGTALLFALVFLYFAWLFLSTGTLLDAAPEITSTDSVQKIQHMKNDLSAIQSFIEQKQQKQSPQFLDPASR